MNDNNNKILHPEQKFFFIRKMALKKLDEIEKERELTFKETVYRDQVKASLWEHIVKYARSLAATQLRSYAKGNDYLPDVVQAMSIKFFVNLDKYDPTKATPTTFFKPYFYEAITEYKRKDSQHLTQNDANNIAKVRNAIKQHEALGEDYDYSVLSVDTGLSIKVVKRTIALMNNSLMVNIDDVPEIKAKTLTPEEEYLSEELKCELYNAIDITLQTIEEEYRNDNPDINFTFSFRDFFYAKVNLVGDKSKSYKELSTLFDLPIHEVKNIWNKIKTSLASNKTISKLNNNNDNTDDISLSIHSNASDLMENDILNNI